MLLDNGAVVSSHVYWPTIRIAELRCGVCPCQLYTTLLLDDLMSFTCFTLTCGVLDMITLFSGNVIWFSKYDGASSVYVYEFGRSSSFSCKYTTRCVTVATCYRNNNQNHLRNTLSLNTTKTLKAGYV
jgi:hypothetical protein